MNDVSTRSVYFVSESTGITAEAYGHSLLSQFGDARFTTRYTPFINTREKAQALANELAHRAEAEGAKPIVFATMADEEINVVLKHAECYYFELFDRFLPDLIAAARRIKQAQGVREISLYSFNFNTHSDIFGIISCHRFTGSVADKDRAGSMSTEVTFGI